MFNNIKFWVAAAVISLALSGCLGFNLASQISKARAAETAREDLERANTALVTAIEALAASNAAERDRMDRLNDNLATIAREPVTNGCGPSVHGAIERLRE